MPAAQVNALDFRLGVTSQVIATLQQGKSLCVTGEPGAGKTHLAKLVQRKLNCTYGVYRGDNTKCLQMIATGLELSVYEIDEDTGEPGRALTAKQLKDTIATSLGNTILIADRAHKWPASLKGWLEDLYEGGATLLLLGNQRDLEGILFKVPRISLPPLDEQQIRSIVWSEAARLGIQLSPPKAAEMASRAGGNPLLAKRMVLEFGQGLESKNTQDGANYRDITPFLMAIAGLVGAARFIGLATGDLMLRVIGGVAITIFFSFRSLALLFPKGDRRK